jgi:subfamily B ATP-binding cassette protein MsbA
MEILTGMGLAVIFIYAAGQIRGGHLTVGGLLSFLAAIMMLYKPLKDVTRTNIVLQVALASADRLFEIVDAPNEIVEKPGAVELPRFATTVAYERVGFSYGGEPVLCDVSIVLRRGETVALVGPSGAGKTTLVNLLPRLYDPTSGRITFDGKDLRDATLKSLRRQIGLVTQETILFDTTVAENIAYGEKSPDAARIRAAAQAACADEFIERLPQGYQTPVGRERPGFPGGQRQRLAIARAIYKDAPILILDEATSQLDSESEAVIGRALGNLMKGRTTLVIAHRLSTVRRADRILVLDRGRIVEEGSHAALLTRRASIAGSTKCSSSPRARRGLQVRPVSLRSMTGFGRAPRIGRQGLVRRDRGPERQQPLPRPDGQDARGRGRARAGSAPGLRKALPSGKVGSRAAIEADVSGRDRGQRGRGAAAVAPGPTVRARGNGTRSRAS